MAGTVWELGPFKCNFRACLAANFDFSRALAIFVVDLAPSYNCQTTAWTRLVNVYSEQFFASVYGLVTKAQKSTFWPDIGRSELFNARAAN